MKKYLFTICFLIIFFACDKENTETSVNNYKEQSRLRLDEFYSVIVTQHYTANLVQNCTYEIVQSTDLDKYGILALKTNNNEIRLQKLGIMYSNERKPELVIQDDPLSKNRNRSGGQDDKMEFGCECNDNHSEVDDCVKRTYYGKLHFCDGNFCNACSLIVVLPSSEIKIYDHQSAIIFN